MNPDWLDVRRRATAMRAEQRRNGGRRVALVAAVAAAVTLPAIAIAAATDRLPGFKDKPAPPEVQASFVRLEETLSRLAAADLPATAINRGVRPGEAKGVLAFRSPAGTVRIWTAPTETGEVCRLIQIGDERVEDHAFTCAAPPTTSPAPFRI